jgi:hypothetical protein
MRTTLTIDDDVAFGLKKAQEHEPAKSFKEIVNEMLRRGLKNNTAQNRIKKRFRVEPLDLGLRTDLNFDNIEEVLDILEGPNRK